MCRLGALEPRGLLSRVVTPDLIDLREKEIALLVSRDKDDSMPSRMHSLCSY